MAFGLGGLVEAKAGYGLLRRLIHFASLPWLILGSISTRFLALAFGDMILLARAGLWTNLPVFPWLKRQMP